MDTGNGHVAAGAPVYDEETAKEVIRGDMPVAAVFLDSRFVVHGFNRGYAGILSRYNLSLPDGREGVPCFECLPESTSRLKPVFAQTLDRGLPVRLNNYKLDTVFGERTVTTSWNSYHAPVVNRSGEVRGLLAFIHDMTPQVEAEIRIRDLETDVAELKSALRAVMALKHEDKAALEANLAANVRHLVLPLLDELKGAFMTPRQRALLSVAESGLDEITSPFSHGLASDTHNLTPKEIQVAHLIKEGKGTKEIAQLLSVSTGSISTHRNHIRKKLGLTHSRTPLRAFLLQLGR